MDSTDTQVDGDGYGQGEEILLFNIDGVIEGRTASSGGTRYFTISVNTDSGSEDFGKVVFSQEKEIWHASAGNASSGNHDDVETLRLDGAGEYLRLTQTVTDADGDSDSASLDLIVGSGGASIFSIKDDGPTAVAVPTGTTALPTLQLDETTPLENGSRSVTSSSSFAANFGSPLSYGSDGSGSVDYSLTLSGVGIASGMFSIDATDIEVLADGYGQGDAILLFDNNGVIEGRTGTSSGDLFFAISVNNAAEATDFGKVTLTQYRNIWHADAGDADDSVFLALAAGGYLRLTQTLTDGDGDTASAFLDLVNGTAGSSVFSIKDDAPSALADSPEVLLAALAMTPRDIPQLPMLQLDETTLYVDGLRSITSSTSLGPDFGSSLNYGTDGAGRIGYALGLSSDGIGSGLYALNNAVTTPGSYGKGAQILLFQNSAGVIEGRTGSSSGTLYFSISVNNTTTSPDFGKVTFAQVRNIWHPSPGSTAVEYDDVAMLTLPVGSGAFIRLLPTLTDADGDTVTLSAAIDLATAGDGESGFSIFSIKDDGPAAEAISTGTTQLPTLQLDETTPLLNGTRSVTSSSSFAANFGSPFDHGTDGAGSVAYALSLSAEGIDSGLFALNNTATTPGSYGKGAAILLFSNNGIIEGRTGSATGTLNFTIAVNNTVASPDFGKLTFSQERNIWHANVSDPDDAETLTLSAGGYIRLTQLLTDADGDTSSAFHDLANGSEGTSIFTIFSIKDDAPVAVATATGTTPLPTLRLDETTLPIDGVRTVTSSSSVASNFGGTFNYGTDGPGGAAYALSLSGSGISSGLYALDATDVETVSDGYGQGESILLFNANGVIEGRTGSSSGTLYFTISINNTAASPDFGKLTFSQARNVWHPDRGNPDDSVSLALAAGAFIRLTQTLTDADGDNSTASHDLVSGTSGASIFSVSDDGPSFTPGLISTLAPATVDENDLETNGAIDIGASLSAAIAYGSDAAGSIAYALSLSGSSVDSGLFAFDSSAPGGQGSPILLNASGGVITGSVGDTAYFTLQFSPSGVLTFDQLRPVWHSRTLGQPDTMVLRASAGALLANATLTDADGDTTTRSLDLGQGDLVRIQDTRPSLTLVVTGVNDVSEGSDAVFKVSFDGVFPAGSDSLLRTIALALSDVTTQGPADYEGTYSAYTFLDPLDPGTRIPLNVIDNRVVVPDGVTAFYVVVRTVNDGVLEVPAESLQLTASFDAPSLRFANGVDGALRPGASDSDISTIFDDGTGTVYDDLGRPTGAPADDDRPISINSFSVNEGSSHALFRVVAVPGSTIRLNLSAGVVNLGPDGLGALGDGIDYGTADGSSVDSGDLDLEIWSGSAWVPYSGVNLTVPEGTGDAQPLLVRTRIVNDTPYERSEDFRLTATYYRELGAGSFVPTNSSFTGTATIRDDGEGVIFLFDGPNAAFSGTSERGLDDDLRLFVSSSTVNEASSHAVFTVETTGGQFMELSLADGTALRAPGSDPSLNGTQDYGPGLEFWDGSVWVAYTGRFSVPGSGALTLLVRTPLLNDPVFEGPETFSLSASYFSASTGGTVLRAATGQATVRDDGLGVRYEFNADGSLRGTVATGLDDDRSLFVDSPLVNEASPWVVFRVNGAPGSTLDLVLQSTGVGLGHATLAPPDNGADTLEFRPDVGLQVYNGADWIDYLPETGATFPGNATLMLVRARLNNDIDFEGPETLALQATVRGSSNPVMSATGLATIVDDGTGMIFRANGTEDLTIPRDDDRELKVNSLLVNEGSSYAVFTLTSTAGDLLTLSLLDVSNDPGSTTADLRSRTNGQLPTLQFWSVQDNSWIDVTASVPLPSEGILYVRVNITSEQEREYDIDETFRLRVDSALLNIASFGTATIKDDGTGVRFTGEIRPEGPVVNSQDLDDDLDRDGVLPTVEKQLASLVASLGIGDAQEGDINGDGLPDAEQNGLATLAWRDVESFIAANEGSLTDARPIIALFATEGDSGTQVSLTHQLENIRVVDFSDPLFGSAAQDLPIDPVSGARMLRLANGSMVAAPYDPLRFDVAPRDDREVLEDVFPSAVRPGTQVRIFIDMRASNLPADAFNRYFKFVSADVITAAGDDVLLGLDGQPITVEGWHDFTQIAPGGDGARFVIENDKLVGIEITLTDNGLGDSNLLFNRIADPGVPAYVPSNMATLLPTEDGLGLRVIGDLGQRLWVDFSAVLSNASLQNGYDLLRIRGGESLTISAIGSTPGSGFLGDQRLELQVGDELRFIQLSGAQPAISQPAIEVFGEDSCIVIRLNDDGGDGDFDDLVLKAKVSARDPYPLNTRMAVHQTSSQKAFLDLSWISDAGITLSFDVRSDCGQRNTIALVKVDVDENGVPLGTVNNLTPGAAGFDQAVRDNLLTVNNAVFSYSQSGVQTVSGQTVSLQGSQRGLYAPVLLTEAGAIYTFGAASSSDASQHVKVLGANSFGFEDLPGSKADFDYDDLVLSVRVAEPERPQLQLSDDGRGLTVVPGNGLETGLWLDLNAVLANASWQNGFDLMKRGVDGEAQAVGSVAAAPRNGFFGSRQLYLGVGESLYFQQNSNDDAIQSAPALRVTRIGERYRIALDDTGLKGASPVDGDFDDLVIDIDSSLVKPCEDLLKLASQQLTSSAGILDLTGIGSEGLSLGLSILSDAGGLNTLSFVRLDTDPLTGLPSYSVAGVEADNSVDFREAVRSNLVDLKLAVGGQEARSHVWELSLDDSGYYAAVLTTAAGDLYTFGDNTSVDGRQHLKLLGDNAFGFEDLSASLGADWDYNDLIVKATVL